MSNSNLVTYTKISPNKNTPRNHAIDTLTIHMVVGQVTIERLGEIFANPAKQASSNYGVDKDGRIGMFVEEIDRSWCSSSRSNDHRAITIEVASDTKSPYAITEKAYKALINLCVDICKRNGKKKLIWLNNKAQTLAYVPKEGEMIMTAHQYFAATACPGEWLLSHFAEIAEAVTALLNPVEPIAPTVTLLADTKVYMNAADAVNHRNAVGTYKAGTYYVFRTYTVKSKDDATNITKTKGTAGAWVATEDINKKTYTTKDGDTVDVLIEIGVADVGAVKVAPGQTLVLN